MVSIGRVEDSLTDAGWEHVAVSVKGVGELVHVDATAFVGVVEVVGLLESRQRAEQFHTFQMITSLYS